MSFFRVFLINVLYCASKKSFLTSPAFFLNFSKPFFLFFFDVRFCSPKKIKQTSGAIQFVKNLEKDKFSHSYYLGALTCLLSVFLAYLAHIIYLTHLDQDSNPGPPGLQSTLYHLSYSDSWGKCPQLVYLSSKILSEQKKISNIAHFPNICKRTITAISGILL